MAQEQKIRQVMARFQTEEPTGVAVAQLEVLVLAFRCIHRVGRLDEFWKHRLNAKLASNDCLPLAA